MHLDDDAAVGEVDLVHDVFEGREQQLAAVAHDDVDVVGAGREDVGDAAQLLALGVTARRPMMSCW